MKKTLNAIEMMLPEGIEPIAYACSGYLRAFMWQSEDGCHFAICREDPIDGEFDTTLTPADLEHLAKLTAAIANTFHIAGNPEIELVNDLGCLAHCLGQTLGVEFDDAGRPIRGNIQ